jgi:beta-glucanase (GH16 family)
LPEGKKWTLAWSDEFDGDVLDTDKWGFRLKFWGDEGVAYTDQGVSLDGHGNVVIRPVVVDGCLRSAQLQTGSLLYDQLDFDGAIKNRMERRVGDNPWGEIELWPFKPLEKPKFMHRYGYYEARVKFQKRPFWWSAFWIQSPNTGSTSDPATSGVECDIIENFGDGQLTSGCIYGGYGKGLTNEARIHYPYVEDGEYHRIGMEWSPDGYVYYFDGKETARTTGPVSHTDQYVLLTTEIKGYRHGVTPTWTEEDLEDCFVADYVRVFDAIEK